MASTKFRFAGMNNVLDVAQIPVDEGSRASVYSTAHDLLNVDAGTGGKARRRRGYSKVSTNRYHSVFGAPGIAYAITGRRLQAVTRQGEGVSLTDLALLDSTSRAHFTPTPIGVALSNETDIGIISGGAYAPLELPPSEVTVDAVTVPSYKVALPAGRFLAWYNGVLYSLVEEDGESWLYHTDGYDLVTDTREGYFRFAGAPTALAAVDDGIYVGAGGKLYFLPGDGPESYTERTALDFSVIPYAFTADRAEDLGLEGFSGQVAIFLTRRGYVFGGNGGRIVQRAEVEPATASTNMAGFVAVRRERGEVHCVAGLQGEGVSDNRYIPMNAPFEGA